MNRAKVVDLPNNIQIAILKAMDSLKLTSLFLKCKMSHTMDILK